MVSSINNLHVAKRFMGLTLHVFSNSSIGWYQVAMKSTNDKINLRTFIKDFAESSEQCKKFYEVYTQLPLTIRELTETEVSILAECSHSSGKEIEKKLSKDAKKYLSSIRAKLGVNNTAAALGEFRAQVTALRMIAGLIEDCPTISVDALVKQGKRGLDNTKVEKSSLILSCFAGICICLSILFSMFSSIGISVTSPLDKNNKYIARSYSYSLYKELSCLALEEIIYCEDNILEINKQVFNNSTGQAPAYGIYDYVLVLDVSSSIKHPSNLIQQSEVIIENNGFPVRDTHEGITCFISANTRYRCFNQTPIIIVTKVTDRTVIDVGGKSIHTEIPFTNTTLKINYKYQKTFLDTINLVSNLIQKSMPNGIS